MDRPKDLYAHLEKYMKANGFKLTKANLVQKEKPNGTGVFFEVLTDIIRTLGLFLVVLMTTFASLLGALRSDNGNAGMLLIAGPIALLIAGLLLMRVIFKYLDLKRREYKVYSDAIEYKEGFLTKHYAFFPIENLSDSEITQSLTDKMLGLYDVKVSCKGTGQHVRFRNMANGDKLEKNIDALVAKAKPLAGKPAPRGSGRAGAIGAGLAGHGESSTKMSSPKMKAAAKHRPSLDTSFTAAYKMHTMRTMMPVLIFLGISVILFPLLPIAVISLVAVLISVSATKYRVKKQSMESKFDFISSRTAEFTNDKITAVVLQESFIDRWFNTCTIKFMSIGSAQDIIFKNIPKTQGLYTQILAKAGMNVGGGESDVLYRMNSAFRVIDFIRTSLFSWFILLVLIFGFMIAAVVVHPAFILVPFFLIAIVVVVVAYLKVYYRRSKMTFHKEYMHFRKGTLFRTEYFVLYDNVKDIMTVKYPMSTRGTIRFNVAGEHVVQQGRSTSMMSNSFTIHYVPRIQGKDELIDTIFFKRPGKAEIDKIDRDPSIAAPKPIMVSRPSLANSVVPLLIVSVIIFPLILFLPITLPWAIISVRHRSYMIQPYRVVAKSGIWYKRQVTIVFNKIDTINQQQGAMNKMFGNGNITVNTAGSSSAEMVIHNIPDYKKFYKVLKDHY